MSLSFSEFHSGLSDLRFQINLLAQARPLYRKLLSSNKAEADAVGLTGFMQEFATLRSHDYHYRACIVSLYGLLERFVESLLAEYVSEVARISPSYDDLPEKIRENHFLLSLEVLNRHSSQKYQKTVDQASMVSALHSCFSKDDSFRLNDSAFSFHTANFKNDVVRQSFLKVGVSLENLNKAGFLVDAMQDRFPDENNPFFVIDDLAERRNEVAHGGASDFLSVDIIKDYVDVVEAYVKSLVVEARSSIVRQAIGIHGNALGKPDKVFMSEIAGYYSVGIDLRLGDLVAVIDSKKSVRLGRIKSIQVDNVPVGHSSRGSDVGICMGLNITRGCRISHLPNSVGHIENFGHGI